MFVEGLTDGMQFVVDFLQVLVQAYGRNRMHIGVLYPAVQLTDHKLDMLETLLVAAGSQPFEVPLQQRHRVRK
jgi:hypothetical protein